MSEIRDQIRQAHQSQTPTGGRYESQDQIHCFGNVAETKKATSEEIAFLNA
jgi:hypothetical protein